MTRTPLEAKCRGQRISQAELVIESQERLRECGVPNHQRAQCLSLLTQHVVGNPNPVLCQQQPKRPRFKGALPPAWRRAYGLVLNYLKERNLEFTINTVTLERPDILELTSPGRPLSELVQTGITGTVARAEDRLQQIRSSASSASESGKFT
jgi:hypothetical protein